MIDPNSIPGADLDSDIAELVDEITNRLVAGEKVEIDEYIDRFPNCAERLRQLLPTIAAMNSISEESHEDVSHPVPRELGGFRILRQIGRGGMGVVYLAEQVGLERQVALKVLPFAALLDDRQLQRFKNEARAAAMLKHPNIVSVHAVGVEQGTNFYVMDYVEGQGLDDLAQTIGDQQDVNATQTESALETAPLAHLTTANSTNRKSYYYSVAKLGVQLANALHYAHGEGVIHRDIKPSNVIIDRLGVPHITDFGLARIQSDKSFTATGDIVGTLRYMSPEQLESASYVDHRSDVYSLGLTLYELIARQPAFTGDSREQIMRNILDGRQPLLTRIDRRIPQDLSTIVAKATARDANDRYQTAEQLATDLQNFIDHRPVIARAPNSFEKLRRWARRSPVVASLITVVALLLLTITSLSVWVAWKERDHGIQQGKLITSLREMDYDQSIRSAHLAIQNSDFHTAQRLLTRIRQTHPKKKTTFEFRYLNHKVSIVNQIPKIQLKVDAYNVRYSPDGKTIACCDFVGMVTLLDARTRQIIWHRGRESEDGHESQVFSVLFTKKREVISCGENDATSGTIKIWNHTNGALIRTESLPENALPFAMAFCEVNQLLAVSVGLKSDLENRRTQILLFHLVRDSEGHATLQKSRSLDVDGRAVHDVCFSADGKLLAAATNANQLALWKTDNLEKVSTHEFSDDVVVAVDSSPTNPVQVAVGVNGRKPISSGDVYVLDLASGQRQRVYRTSQNIRSIRWSPDAKSIAVCERSSGHVDSIDLQNQETRRFVGHSANVRRVDFSPDGNTIASAASDGTICFMDRNGPTVFDQKLVSDGANIAFGLAFDEKNNRLLAGYYSGRIVLWSLTNDSQVRKRNTPTPAVYAVDISTDGKHALYAGGNWPVDEDSGTLAVMDATKLTMDRSFDVPKNILPFDAKFVPPDEKSVAASVGKSIHFWDRETGELKLQLKPAEAVGWIKHFDFDNLGRFVAAAHLDAEKYGRSAAVLVWDVDNRKPIFLKEETVCLCAAISEDGKILAHDTGAAIEIHHLASKELLKTLPGHTGGTYALDFSPDRSRLVSAGKDGTVNLWNVETGNCVLSFDYRHWVQRVIFSSDGTIIAVGCKDEDDNGIVRLIRAPLALDTSKDDD